jgi:hypothetical protein
VPLHKIRLELMPRTINFGPGGLMRLSRVILAEKPDSSMPAHTNGREGNLPAKAQI